MCRAGSICYFEICFSDYKSNKPSTVERQKQEPKEGKVIYYSKLHTIL